MKLSVIIPTYNRHEILRKTLEGLCRQTRLDLLQEVIVVSDGSTDLTTDTVESFSDRLPLTFLQCARSGVSAARNKGLKTAQAPIMLFLDDDVIPSAGLVSEHISFHDAHREDNYVLLGYVTWHPEMRTTPFMRWYGEYGALFGYSLLKEGAQADFKYLYTCNVSFKTAYLLAHGGFNEALTVLEDHELSYRLTQDGMKMFFRRAALGYHYQSFTFDEACQRLNRYRGGLNAFLSTEAGQRMARKNNRIWHRGAKAAAQIALPVLDRFRFIVDRSINLPNSIYRLYYWSYATLDFWESAAPRVDGFENGRQAL
jgi:glycosyltransferase involved in cell wall biosynthesis